MQKPRWRFTLSNEQKVLLQANISLGSVTFLVNDEPFDTREISGYENIIPIKLYDQTFSLILYKKPVGGYDYSLETQNGEKLVALDSNPTIALSHQAESAAESSELKKNTRIHWFILAFVFGGCLGPLFLLIGFAVYESDRYRASKIVLFVILIMLALAWDIVFIFILNRYRIWVRPLQII